MATRWLSPHVKALIALFILFIQLSVYGLTAQEFDFTPRYSAYQMEGVSEERPYFTEGDTRWVFFLPGILHLTGSSSEATFTLKEDALSVIRISKSPLTPETPLTIANFPTYRKAAESLFKSSAKDVQLLGERMKPYSINGWQSHEFQFSFSIPGEILKRAVVFLNFDQEQQWVITVTSREKDFQKMNDLTNMILNSLHAVTKEDENKVPVGS